MTDTNTTDSTDSKKKESTILMFPLDLRENDTREVMRFSMRDRANPNMDGTKSIWLYTPPQIQVTDGGSYSEIDLGIAGAVYGKVQDSMSRGTGLIDSIKNVGAADVYQGLKNTMAEKTGMGQGAMMKTGQAVNPFRNTKFSGNAMRSFQFAWKMVAQSADEAEVIKNIENVFRKFLYAEYAESELALKYPPYWVIEFIKGNKETENPYMPFINLSYLQGVDVVYNASSSVFHADGAPIEMTMTLRFTETKMMTRGDLYKGLNDWSPDYTYDRSALADLSEEAVGEVAKATGDEVNKIKDGTG